LRERCETRGTWSPASVPRRAMDTRPHFCMTFSPTLGAWKEYAQALVSRWQAHCGWSAIHAWAAADPQCAKVLTPMSATGRRLPSDHHRPSPTLELWNERAPMRILQCLRYSLLPFTQGERPCSSTSRRAALVRSPRITCLLHLSRLD
jgi:hypothetical protein